MATIAQICNMALKHLGVSYEVTTITENTKEAKQLNAFFDTARDAVTGDCEWTFSTRRDELTLAAGVTPQDYSFAYSLPAGCIHVFRLADGVRNKRPDEETPFRLELNAAGAAHLLLCDVEEATAVYAVSMATKEALLPADFVLAFTYKLAQLTCVPLLGANTVAQAKELEAAYERAISRSRRRDLSQGKDDPPKASEFELARL